MAYSANTKIHWELGTAYDLYISLRTLHMPDRFGLRASWAAGVRSRLQPDLRQVLELADEVCAMPLFVVYDLPKPKDSAALLTRLASIPSRRRLETVGINYFTPQPVREVLQNTSPNHKWSAAERQVIIDAAHGNERRTQPAYLEALYHAWSQREEFGDKYLQAIQSYVDNFFAEEELRLLPILRRGLSHAQMRAGSLPFPAMLEELTSGVRYPDIRRIQEIHLGPSFWGSPLMYLEQLEKDSLLILFGARPDNMSIIPGDPVPDALLQAMKALSDPTRLRILRTLAQTPQTAAQLSRFLRLRPPTVTHHLNALRIAGLVQIIIDSEGERQYATRFEGFVTTTDLLNRFVGGD